MKCSACESTIPNGDEREHNHHILCEDCYMEALSPARFCDPWASYSAKSFAEKNTVTLTDHQKLILDTLKTSQGMSPEDLMNTLAGRISPEEGTRACASLNRMDKIAIENNRGSVMIRLKG